MFPSLKALNSCKACFSDVGSLSNLAPVAWEKYVYLFVFLDCMFFSTLFSTCKQEKTNAHSYDTPLLDEVLLLQENSALNKLQSTLLLAKIMWIIIKQRVTDFLRNYIWMAWGIADILSLSILVRSRTVRKRWVDIEIQRGKGWWVKVWMVLSCQLGLNCGR